MLEWTCFFTRLMRGVSLDYNDTNTTIEALRTQVRQFLKERDWERYHNPKDLAESICIEASELLQVFQWIKSEETEQFKNKLSKVERIKEELSDVILYCLSMAIALDIDLTSAILDKIEQNRKKYPQNLYKGKAHLSP